MAGSGKTIDWLGAGEPAGQTDRERLWEERRAIELERLAIEDAIRRALTAGSADVAQPYRPPRSILQNPYLPSVCLVLLLVVLNYLGQG